MSALAVVDITGVANTGAGVGRLPDGRAVFVQRTAPGDSAEVRVVERKRTWARAELVRVLRPSSDRRAPPCPHYARCGGCTLEHLAYPAQLEAKRSVAVETLRRIGGVDAGDVAVVASPDEFRYRNRVSFTLLRLGSGRVIAGFHEIDRPGRIVDIDEACLLPEEPVAAAWGRLRREWGENARRLPSGHRLRLTLRASAAGAATLVVDGGYSAGRPEELLQRIPQLVAVWHRPPGGELRLLAGQEAVPETWQDEELGLSGAVFLQVNRGAAALLEEHVLALAGPARGLRVVDAYCGVGLHARRLARAGARVLGIELDPLAVEQARRDAPDGLELVVGKVEERLAEALPADLVIVNPPRAGLEPRVPELLRENPPGKIIYVSCNPATLGRDLERLEPVFRPAGVRCFDLFPQTAHVETVVELVRRVDTATLGRGDSA